MLELFRSNHVFNSLLLLVYAFLLRLPVQFAQPGLVPEGRGILTVWILDAVPVQGFIAHVLACLLVFIHAVMINRIVIRHRLTDEMTLFPGLFYILIVSLFPEMISLHALLFANTFIILAVGELFLAHRKKASARRIYNAGFWLSVASFCYFGFTVLFLFGLVTLSIQRTVRSKEWIQYLIGFITPLLILAMIDYLVSDGFYSLQQHLAYGGFLAFEWSWTTPVILHVVVFGLLVLIAFLNYNNYTVRKNIHAQKKIDILYWLMVFAGVSATIQSGITSGDWIILSVPMAVFMGIQFVNFKSAWFAESLHFFFLIFSLGLQFWALL